MDRGIFPVIAADSVDLKASSGFGAVSCPGFPGGDWPLRVVWFACVMPMVLAERFVKPVCACGEPPQARPSPRWRARVAYYAINQADTRSWGASTSSDGPSSPSLPSGEFLNGSRWSPVVPWSSRRRAISSRMLPGHRSPRWCRHDDGNVEARVFSASAAVSPSEHEYKAQVSIKAVPPCRQFVRRWNLRHCGGL